MKKLPVIALVSLFAALSFTSCKKDYVCKCTVTSLIADTTLTFTHNISDSKKKMAEAECDGSKAAYTQLSALIIGTANCELESD